MDFMPEFRESGENTPSEHLHQLRGKISSCAKSSELLLKSITNRIAAAKILLELDPTIVLEPEIVDLEALEQCGAELATQISRYGNTRNAIDDLIEEVQQREASVQHIGDLPPLEEIYKESLERRIAETEDQKSHPAFMDVKQAIMDIRLQQAENTDVFSGSSVIIEEHCQEKNTTPSHDSVCSSFCAPLQLKEVKSSGLDPLTLKPIVECVRNKKCGHIYEKQNITAYIRGTDGQRKKKRPGCPHFGCRNERMTEAQLESHQLD